MLELRVQLREANADPGRIDEATRNLLRELSRRDVIVQRTTSPASPEVKSGAASTVGTLTVALANSPAVAAFVTGIFEWLARSKDRSVKISCNGMTLELSSATSAEQRQLVELLTDHVE